ncbi:MAG TPA: DEAD/DEAH box helicase [Anaerolineales bacterium]|nr:DEAD/DEAH box helicase [Anaerolineales bacterium]
MSLSALLSHWRSEPTIGGNLVDWRTIPARAAQYAPIPAGLHPGLGRALSEMRITKLYTHQSAVWDRIRQGRHPVIVTGTASGKTLAYNLPVLDHLLRNPQDRALFLFPTKALAQDQLEILRTTLANANIDEDAEDLPGRPFSLLAKEPTFPVSLAVYDGDTPSHARVAIRDKARLVLSNPDMLHAGVLPHHARWAEFFAHLKFVVIDEIHAYRGVFGSHVANVIRRLKRVAKFYGSRPQFILTSATIANPVELGERLIEESVDLVDNDGAARGPRHFLIYNPPVVDPDLGLRRSALLETVRLVDDLLQYEIQTIIFARARRTVEVILTYLRENLSSEIPLSEVESIDKLDIRGYRSGYLPRQRREIEHGLRRGQIKAVVATNALELGIDIGSMGAAVLSGYPGTIAATWQQVGRAGRGSQDSLAVLVATASPLDQFLAHHPDYFFERSPEQALINPDNILILLDHLQCAAFEIPFGAGETFGNVPSRQVSEFLQFLHQSGVIHHSGDKYFWMAEHYPAERLSLRSASANRVLLQVPQEDGWMTIGEVDVESAPWMVHPQAVYLHEAQTYLVDELDLLQNIARLRPSPVDFYTRPKTDTTVQLEEIIDQSPSKGATKACGDIIVTSQVTGFRKVKWFTHENLGEGNLDLPPSLLNTTGYWIALSEETLKLLRDAGFWSNDPNRYGPEWERQRARARARDAYRCQVCGAPENGRAHHVHHKIPFRAFESAAQANQLDNLITLCPSCHQRAEAAVRVRSGLTGLAYALGNLAPLFLMCDDRDLGVHSDPKSPLADGNPAVLIFDRVPAGIGFSQRLYELHGTLLQRALELVEDCECVDGCPSCVGPGGENGAGGKRETLALLKALC